MPQEKLDIGRVIGRAFQIILAHFLFLGLTALLLVSAPSIVLLFVLPQAATLDPLSIFLSAANWVGLIIGLLFGYLAWAIFVATGLRHLRGQAVQPGEILLAALYLWPPLVMLGICTSLLVIVGLVLLVVPGIIAYLMFFVAVPAYVDERSGVIDAMQRSLELSTGSRGWIFLLAIIMIILSAVVSASCGAIAGGIAGAVGTDPFRPLAIGQALGQAVGAVISAAIVAATYLELRRIMEGGSDDELAEVFA